MPYATMISLQSSPPQAQPALIPLDVVVNCNLRITQQKDNYRQIQLPKQTNKHTNQTIAQQFHIL